MWRLVVFQTYSNRWHSGKTLAAPLFAVSISCVLFRVLPGGASRKPLQEVHPGIFELVAVQSRAANQENPHVVFGSTINDKTNKISVFNLKCAQNFGYYQEQRSKRGIHCG